MADSDDDSSPAGSGEDQDETDDAPAAELPSNCTANRFRVRVDRILLTGAVKAKYEVQGVIALHGYHVGRAAALKRIKGLPLQWRGNEDTGMLEFEVDTENHCNNYIVLKLERKDGFHRQSMDHSFRLNVSVLQGLRRTDQESEAFQLKTAAFKSGITARLFCTSTILDPDDRKFEIVTSEFHRHPELRTEHTDQDLPPPYTANETDPYTEATHSLLNHVGVAQYQLRVLHCKDRCVSALQIISTDDVLARAHLIGMEQLVEMRNQFLEKENLLLFSLDEEADERAMLIKSQTEPWMIVKASYESSLSVREVVKVQYYSFASDTTRTVDPVQAHSSIDLRLATVFPYSGYVSVSADNPCLAESLAFCFSVAILFNLCVPNRANYHWDLNEHTFFAAAGSDQELPSNSSTSADQRRPDLSFLAEVGWEEQEEDPHLPPYSPDLLPPPDFPDDHQPSASPASSDAEIPDAENDASMDSAEVELGEPVEFEVGGASSDEREGQGSEAENQNVDSDAEQRDVTIHDVDAADADAGLEDAEDGDEEAEGNDGDDNDDDDQEVEENDGDDDDAEVEGNDGGYEDEDEDSEDVTADNDQRKDLIFLGEF